MSQKKVLLVPVVCMIAVAAALIYRYWVYALGYITYWKYPIHPNEPIHWREPDISLSRSSHDQRPNIIIILTDDLGFNDVSFFGGGYYNGTIKTPNIDSIAARGFSFQNAYAGHATCAPSRASLLTGKFATRMGFEFTPISDWGSWILGRMMHIGPLQATYNSSNLINGKARDYIHMSLPNTEITIAEALRDHGYKTLHLGKWHVGFYENRAINRGFNETLGFSIISQYLETGDPKAVNCYVDDPFDEYVWALSRYVVQKDGGQYFSPDGKYLTDYLADEAVKAIGVNQKVPFFMYMALTSVHTPLQALLDDYNAVKHIPDHCDRVYAGMILALDRAVGKVLDALKELSLDNNTILIFTNDNGAPGYINQRTLNAPYRGWKGTFFEGGLRVPMLMQWPATLPEGGQFSPVVSHVDLFPTILDAAGVNLQHFIDGKSLLPFLSQGTLPNKSDILHEKLFWRSGHYRAMRAGDWKIQISDRPKKIWLYHVSQDPLERVNLAENDLYHNQLELMVSLIEEENSKQMSPIWTALSETPVLIDKIHSDKYMEGDEYVYFPN